MVDGKTTEILEFVREHPLLSSKAIHNGLASQISYATVKRVLTRLVIEKLVVAVGQGRGRKYEIGPAYQLFYPVNPAQYFEKEIDEREIKPGFNFTLITEVLHQVDLFTVTELQELTELQQKFETKVSELSRTEYGKEYERLAIDLSWKSSQIEGNTYSLLETELLLKEKVTAAGKTNAEAMMLLNHKVALDFILENPGYISSLSSSSIEDIHSMLVKDLDVDRNIRKRRVGISGTNYKPLDNEFQIKEALGDMCELINSKASVFEKSLLVLVLISYIQAFGDGNKRTARIISNAILMGNEYCPISYRTIDSVEYKKAMLIFYEQNNISLFKKIFVGQFEFAVNTYF